MTQKYSNKSELRSELFSVENKSFSRLEYLVDHGTQTLLITDSDLIHAELSIQASKSRDGEGFAP